MKDLNSENLDAFIFINNLDVLHIPNLHLEVSVECPSGKEDHQLGMHIKMGLGSVLMEPEFWFHIGFLKYRDNYVFLLVIFYVMTSPRVTLRHPWSLLRHMCWNDVMTVIRYDINNMV